MSPVGWLWDFKWIESWGYGSHRRDRESQLDWQTFWVPKRSKRPNDGRSCPGITYRWPLDPWWASSSCKTISSLKRQERKHINCALDKRHQCLLACGANAEPTLCDTANFSNQNCFKGASLFAFGWATPWEYKDVRIAVTLQEGPKH